jgi:hypothetical protein
VEQNMKKDGNPNSSVPEVTPRVSLTVAITVLTAFLGGGLAGSVFNWFVNRAQPTVLTYNIGTANLASEQFASVVPDLRIQIGNEQIKSLYTHTIELSVAKGPYIDSIDIAITLPDDVRLFGTKTVSPSPLHTLDCSNIKTGLRCRLGPLSQGITKPFRIVIAADKEISPHVDATAKNVELVSGIDYIARAQESVFADPTTLIFLAIVLCLIGMITVKALKRSKSTDREPDIIVGRIFDNQGNPVSNADVEVSIISPIKKSSSVKTDSIGDFVIGSYKVPMFKAKVRIRHSDFETLEFEADSPIITARLLEHKGADELGSAKAVL